MPKRRSPTEALSREKFRQNMVAFRAESGLSYDVAAARIGISPAYLRKMEKGSRGIPTLEVLRRIATTYGRLIEDMDAEKPGPSDPSRMPAVVYNITLEQENIQLIGDDVSQAVREIDEINRRLLQKLRAAREARAKKPHARR